MFETPLTAEEVKSVAQLFGHNQNAMRLIDELAEARAANRELRAVNAGLLGELEFAERDVQMLCGELDRAEERHLFRQGGWADRCDVPDSQGRVCQFEADHHGHTLTKDRLPELRKAHASA